MCDLSNYENIVCEAEFYHGGESLAVDLKDRYAFVADGYERLEVIDYTNIRKPQKIGSFTNYSYINDVHIQDDVAFLSDFEVGLRVFNISDLSMLQQMAFFPMESLITKIIVKNATGYLISENRNPTIIDLTDLHNPIKLGEYAHNTSIFDIKVEHDVAYLAMGADGIAVLNTSDPSQIMEIARMGEIGNIQDLAFISSILAAACGNQGIKIFNTTNLTEITTLTNHLKHNITNVRSISVHSSLISAIDRNNGLVLLEFQSINTLSELAHIANLRSTVNMAMDGDLLVCANLQNGISLVANDADGDQLFDVEETDRYFTDPRNPDTDGMG